MRYDKTTRWTLTSIAAMAAGGLVLAALGRREPHAQLHRLERDALDHWQALAGIGALAAIAAGGMALAQRRQRNGGLHVVHESMELDVPVGTAYNQWTQFEDFPKFMATVQEVRQVDDTHLHWRALVGGKVKEWQAEITEQLPDERIAWRSISGVHNAGLVTFHKLGEGRCRVDLEMEYTPETLVEKIGDAVGAVKLTAKGNLVRFRQLLEKRGQETGAWRGSVAPTH